jgi:hypothetical protein
MKNIDISDSIRTSVNENYQIILNQIELIKSKCKNRLNRKKELVKILAKFKAPERKLLLEKWPSSTLTEKDPRLDHLLDENEGEQDISNREDPQPHSFFDDAMHFNNREFN